MAYLFAFVMLCGAVTVGMLMARLLAQLSRRAALSGIALAGLCALIGGILTAARLRVLDIRYLGIAVSFYLTVVSILRWRGDRGLRWILAFVCVMESFGPSLRFRRTQRKLNTSDSIHPSSNGRSTAARV